MPLGKRIDYGDAKFAGLEVSHATDIVETLQSTLLCGFDFLAAPLAHPRYRRSASQRQPSGRLVPPFTRSDYLLSASQWSGQVVGKVSPWINPDSANPILRQDSAAALKQELAWAAHLGLQAVILPTPPERMAAAAYAHILNQVLAGLNNMALWVRIPLAAPSAGGASPGQDPWEWWCQLHTLCEHHSLLGVMLELPEGPVAVQALHRWRGQPLKAASVPATLFTTNKKGFPVLAKGHQELLAEVFSLNAQVILSGNAESSLGVEQASSKGGAPGSNGAASSAPPPPPPPRQQQQRQQQVVLSSQPGTTIAVVDPGESHPLRAHWEYLCYLFRKMPELSDKQVAESGYRDYLQAPLQPLQDNLESQTYEVFERDTIKYTTYQEAVRRALLDRVSEEEAAKKVTVVMVVGAGRAPLVRASLAAAKEAARKVKVYAVEKNPNAVVTIQHLIVSEGWQDKVTLVSADMRHWQAPEQADILVSELLGSFGDNELSPECLDGAQRFLAPGGISIPSAYTSYLAPVTSSKLWNDVRAYKDLKHFETPYVVKFHRHTLLSPPQPVFTFEHPNRAEQIDNSRSITLRFQRPAEDGAALLHGFAGYFDTTLYKDVMLSTHPATHTPDMSSWFPIYFPLKEPQRVAAGQAVEVAMWRCCAPHKVWYEWAVLQPAASHVHNVSGRSYYVGL